MYFVELPADAASAHAVPAGPCSIGRHERKPGLQLREWIVDAELVLAPGERRVVEIR